MTFDPVELVRKTARALKWDDSPDLALKLALSDIPQVNGNPSVLETTLRNLLINAREALDGRGEITVETRAEPQYLVLSVSDNGPGMSREFIETRLFRPFQTTKKKGTGLGLFSCKLLIEQSGGTITVNSREGEGTEFLITLPYARS
ncbi:MAG: sensor histidine kinase [Leptospirillum sp.]